MIISRPKAHNVAEQIIYLLPDVLQVIQVEGYSRSVQRWDYPFWPSIPTFPHGWTYHYSSVWPSIIPLLDCLIWFMGRRDPRWSHWDDDLDFWPYPFLSSDWGFSSHRKRLLFIALPWDVCLILLCFLVEPCAVLVGFYGDSSRKCSELFSALI